jgi:hypothetical protein
VRLKETVNAARALFFARRGIVPKQVALTLSLSLALLPASFELFYLYNAITSDALTMQIYGMWNTCQGVGQGAKGRAKECGEESRSSRISDWMDENV